MQMRIYVDFNTTTTDSKERVYINTQVQPALEKDLYPGLTVTLYDEEMEVEAIRVHHDLGYTVSSAKGGTAHVTLSRYFNPYDRPVRFDEFDRGRVWGAGAPL